jgi:hypothetical protein
LEEKKIISNNPDRLPKIKRTGPPEIISVSKEMDQELTTYTPQQKEELKQLVDLKTQVVKK